jgi:hypothetical protein
MENLDAMLAKSYRHGFVTDIESDTLPPGLDEDVVRFISRKKREPEFMTEWRLKAYRHWLTMREPHWAKLRVNPIDYQSISYFSAPKRDPNAPKSLEEVDPKLLATYEKLGVPLHERARLAGVAVDAVFDSVSVATTYKAKLAEVGIIFCSISEAVHQHPELIALGQIVYCQLVPLPVGEARLQLLVELLIDVIGAGRGVVDGLHRRAHGSRWTARWGVAFISRFHSLIYSRMNASSVAGAVMMPFASVFTRPGMSSPRCI